MNMRQRRRALTHNIGRRIDIRLRTAFRAYFNDIYAMQIDYLKQVHTVPDYITRMISDVGLELLPPPCPS